VRDEDVHETPYVMRRVVGVRKKELPGSPGRFYAVDVLECGHERKKKTVDSAADAVRIALRNLNGTRTVRRCFECATKPGVQG
jgi:hypothetical protein